MIQKGALIGAHLNGVKRRRLRAFVGTPDDNCTGSGFLLSAANNYC